MKNENHEIHKLRARASACRSIYLFIYLFSGFTTMQTR